MSGFPWWIFMLFGFFWMARWMFGQGEVARRRMRDRPGQKDEARLEEALDQRDQVIEDLQRRISELESRLDFTERLLAGKKEPAQV